MVESEMAEPVEPVPNRVGARLRHKREALGLSREDLVELTKIPERHLLAIEQDDFAALPARAYATGFARNYARAVGLDEAAVAQEVRAELDGIEAERGRKTMSAFEPGDPARVPGARLAWLSAALALAVIVGGVVLWQQERAPEAAVRLPTSTPAPLAAAKPGASPAAAPNGPVTFTANADRVWVRFFDGSGNVLMQRELAQGESYTLPEGVADPRLRTGRPDALSISVGGQPVPPLAATQQVMRDVPVSAKALLARATVTSPVPTATGASLAPTGSAPAPVGAAANGANPG